ncbi:Sodium/calcium exchanger protein-domain-containing protein [Chaetomium strumarium]|uniref:Sodium/calcium exchanger protein-domain-containing protein n=1 Tax=Chaetomium strumarium TaxID=1170767 RepID=A0AAJ0H1F4_9PEZI|nr:Sodium/calcium exchanger protein-domain-containing protein [Chaetomium strumarium]
MAPSLPMRSRYSGRPTVAALLLIGAITFLALFQSAAGPSSRSHFGLNPRGLQATDVDCRNVHHAVDQCAFVLANCEDDEAGLIHYLSFYYCTLGSAKPVAFAILTAWLGLLFTTIGIAASDFFSVNLSTIASVLGLSESLAGVTFLAFGNGSPDVFSTFAAMGSNSGSMAVGELIGAAGFITAVVAGSMALVREFKVSKRTFVRDILFFILAISFTMVFLADGELHLWECFTMIGFYLFYVVVVVGWHWLTVRRRKQRQRDVASRTHFHGVSPRGADELEPYRDEPDEDEAAPVGGRSRGASEPGDISMLERGPRIEVDGVPSAGPDEEEEQREVHVAAEMASSMRVNRPRWGRSNTTITPIRPSLLGALEFRSVLSSLQKERNMHLGPLHGRSYSVQHSANSTPDDPRGRPRTKTMPSEVRPGPTERSLSYGNQPLNLDNAALPRRDAVPMPESRGSSAARTIDGMLAPPLGSGMPVDHATQHSHPAGRVHRLPHIQIPSPSGRSSGRSSPSFSPFPGLSESPAVLTPIPEPGFPFPPLNALDARHHSFPGLDDHAEHPRPVNWWPYGLLPAPHVLLSTMFPTLQGWKEKALWDKAVSLISVPSIFILVATLPVVETESTHNDTEMNSPSVGQPGSAAPLVSVDDGAQLEPETEWQAYRRRARSTGSRSPLSMSPSLLSLNAPQPPDHHQPPAVQVPQRPKPTDVGSDGATASSETASGWNRWLVALQLFTGPLFVSCLIWANTADNLEHPVKTLLRMVLYSLLISLCLLAALLKTTSADQKPKYHFVLCFLGFVIGVAWISTIAGEVVGVLKAFGVILDISEAILGLTVFAVGNSLGDLVADVTVARLGYPVMALAACFGGPMLNILLGVGIGGAWMGINSANRKHRKHPDAPLHYKPYRIQIGGTLMISAVTVLLTLLVLLIAVPWNQWVMSRKIGWGLICIWTVGTTVNLVVELTNGFSDVS